MKKLTFVSALVLAGAATLAAAATQAATPAVAAPADAREQAAYTQGLKAYIYAFPYAYMPDARWTRTEKIDHKANTFHHVRNLEDANHLNGGAPNNDTLYSRAWVYLQDEPVILSVPAISDRYYTHEIVDFMGDNFAYVGTRATGVKAGNYAIIGPNWKGTLPPGVVALPPGATPWATILVRTFVKNAGELDTVHAIQDQYKLTPLSQWGSANPTQPKGAIIWEPVDPKTDPLGEWKSITRAMVENPPPASDAAIIASMTALGVGPGMDVDKLDPSTKAGLARAAVDGKRQIAKAFADGYKQTTVNGWYYPPKETGRPTPTRDWLFRDVQMLAGFVANDPIEAVYLNVSLDGSGAPLNGKNRYTITFPKGGLPEVKAFWSITMYNPLYNLVANPINRYSLGDRSGLKTNADGSTTIYLANTAPAADKSSNWLPAPDGDFFLIMRTYLPGPAIINQTWQPPVIAKIN